MSFKTPYDLRREYEAIRAHDARIAGQEAARRREEECDRVIEKVLVFADELAADTRRREAEARTKICAARAERAKQDILREYDRLGLERPVREDGLIPSPSLLMKFGARIIEDGRGHRILTTLPSRGIHEEQHETTPWEMGR